jgi:type III secretory pathway component EscV
MNLKESSKETRKKWSKNNYIKLKEIRITKEEENEEQAKLELDIKEKKLFSGIKPRKRASK